jgi:hypothetical protein
LEEVVKDEKLPGYIFVENKDLVFEEEQNRLNTLDDTTKNHNYSSYGVILNTSNEFKIYKKSMNKDGNIYSIRFISIDEKYPNSELREYISNGIWIDDYNFVYSVTGRGIYSYNAKDRTYKTLLTGNGKYRLDAFTENKLYYDNTEFIEID